MAFRSRNNVISAGGDLTDLPPGETFSVHYDPDARHLQLWNAAERAFGRPGDGNTSVYSISVYAKHWWEPRLVDHQEHLSTGDTALDELAIAEIKRDMVGRRHIFHRLRKNAELLAGAPELPAGKQFKVRVVDGRPFRGPDHALVRVWITRDLLEEQFYIPGTDRELAKSMRETLRSMAAEVWKQEAMADIARRA